MEEKQEETFELLSKGLKQSLLIHGDTIMNNRHFINKLVYINNRKKGSKKIKPFELDLASDSFEYKNLVEEYRQMLSKEIGHEVHFELFQSHDAFAYDCVRIYFDKEKRSDYV